MKGLLLILGVFVLAAGVLLTIKVESHGRRTRLQEKADRVQVGVRSWLSQGRDPSAALVVADQVKPALDAGDPDKAEALPDRALKMLSVGAGGDDSSPLPVDANPEQTSNLYIRPEPVSIEGYEGSAMEPFISPDGHTLFFNNENDFKADTNLHFAERTGKLSFRYAGEVPGVNSKALDAVPSLDSAGHFYFTTLRDYDRTMNSIYVGDLNCEPVRNIRAVPGEISPKTPGTVNMDASISPDGQTLYISRALIAPGAPAPKKCDLLVARLETGAFRIGADSERILKNVNTDALEYAPALSADGLELYFTRASQLRPGLESPGTVRIMVATRLSTNAPFGEPRVLTALTGFVEGPAVSLDGKEMFFHKKVGTKFVIYRAERNLDQR